MSAAGRIRVGIVGAGANTRERHIPNLQAIDGVEVVSVSNRSHDSSQAVASEFGIPGIHEHWTELVADDGVDAVVIGTWPDMHAPVTLAALAAGKHVLCEARLALDVPEARRMRDAARARPELVAQVVPAPATLKFDGKARELIAAGALGRLLVVEARIGGGFADPDVPFSWRHDFARSGYNTMFLGVLYECLMRWVGEATSVVAMSRTFVPARRDGDGNAHVVRVPDHVDVVAQLACGAQAHLRASEVTGFRTGLEISVYGSDATLRLADGELRIGRRGEDELQPVPIEPGEQGGWRVEEEFAGAIRGEEPVTLTTFDDGVRYMEFTEAVARSAASGARVPIPL